MMKQKYCPLLRTGPACSDHCAWYDKLEQQCAIKSIAAELMDMGETVRYEITEKGRERLKGVGENDRQR